MRFAACLEMRNAFCPIRSRIVSTVGIGRSLDIGGTVPSGSETGKKAQCGAIRLKISRTSVRRFAWQAGSGEGMK
jgi:hypothetical protein